MDQYIGRLLDNRYEILEVIGTGGMAVVYKARCHRLNRLVAIKVLKDEFARDDEFRRRFQAEGEAVAMLSHPNIVQVYDVSASDNAYYIVMELIDGITLKQFMEKRGVLNWKETLHFGLQIAKALEHAHGRSIVHRDIKPHNVMVLKNGSVKVTDFGIARVMSKSNTLTKEALGSVHYISPEQAKGGWVDNRSDLYSLGVVMYEMMTGRPPYDGESPVAVAIQHINGGAQKPSQLNPNIPIGLEQIIMKTMALDPAGRYATATEMIHDLDEFRKDPSIHFMPGSPRVSDETKVLNTTLVQEHTPAHGTKATTAEKVAGTARTAQPAGTRAPQTSRPAAPRTNSQENARREAASRKAREELREEIRKEERNRVATVAVIACSVVAVIAIGVFLIALVNGWLIGGEAMVKVPKFVGEYYDRIQPLDGLEIKINSQVYDDTVEAGKVIEQRPEADVEVVQDTVVWLTISLGPEPVVKTMEDLTGWDKSQAESYLLGQGMNPVLMEEQSEEFAPDQVIRTEPAEGEILEEGQTITIYYATVKKAKMPDLIGKDYNVAYTMLSSMDFDKITVEHQESDEPENQVIDQNINAGEEVDIHTEIVLTLATAHTETVRNVVGKSFDVAKGILEGLGFTKVEMEEEISDEPEGTVLKQSVKEGEEVALDTKIILTVATVKTAKMINVVGQQADDAEDNLNDLDFVNVRLEEEHDDAPAGQVIRQSVSRGETVPVDMEIVLTVSLGPKETEPPVTEPPVTEPPTVTKQQTIELPMKEADYVLSLRKDGVPVTDDAHIAAGTSSILLELTGSGTQYYDLYIDGTYLKTLKVEFN